MNIGNFVSNTKNLTKEYQPINLHVLDGNGWLLSEKEKVMGGWKEYYQGKLRVCVPNSGIL